MVRATTSHVATRSRLTRADPARTRALRDGDAHVSKGRPAKRLVRARPHGEGAYGPPRRRTRTRRAPQVGRGTAARRSCSALGWEMSRRARDAEGVVATHDGLDTAVSAWAGMVLASPARSLEATTATRRRSSFGPACLVETRAGASDVGAGQVPPAARLVALGKYNTGTGTGRGRAKAWSFHVLPLFHPDDECARGRFSAEWFDEIIISMMLSNYYP